MFTTGTHSVPDRIVSIAKSYVRPIVRGKEIKKVEFGAKVNMTQVDGINFIEHLSFGPEKQHYSLDKIKARIEKNEILWIFFGVHTANAVRIAKRLAQEKLSHIAA